MNNRFFALNYKTQNLPTESTEIKSSYYNIFFFQSIHPKKVIMSLRHKRLQRVKENQRDFEANKNPSLKGWGGV